MKEIGHTLPRVKGGHGIFLREELKGDYLNVAGPGSFGN